MWTILKFDKNQFYNLNNDIKNLVGKNFKIYRPKILINKNNKKKLVSKELDILGDYLFCFHEEFTKSTITQKLQFCKGVKFLIHGFKESQADIVEFIKKCKEHENHQGYISNNLIDMIVNSDYKFANGPFSNKIFKILEVNKSNLYIALGNIKTSINKDKFLINAI